MRVDTFNRTSRRAFLKTGDLAPARPVDDQVGDGMPDGAFGVLDGGVDFIGDMAGRFLEDVAPGLSGDFYSGAHLQAIRRRRA